MEKKFGIEIKELTDLMQVQLKPDEQQEYLNKHGHMEGLCRKLQVNPQLGLSTSNKADLTTRAQEFGRNEIPPKPPKAFIVLMWEAVQDTTLIILLLCALISLGLSFYHDDSLKPDEEYSQTSEWLEILLTDQKKKKRNIIQPQKWVRF
jgi:Ca2+ transporting ATPase